MAMYHSTRSHEPMLTSKEAIRRGIAPDGGLYVSDDLGSRTVDIAGLASRPDDDIAREVLGALLPDYSPAQIAACVKEAYGSTFASDEVTPVVPLRVPPARTAPPPTCSSCGTAPRARSRTSPCRRRRASWRAPARRARTPPSNHDRHRHLGRHRQGRARRFCRRAGRGHHRVYPEGKVSRVQELQMSTQEGSNVSVCAVRGNFDDAQSAVKRIFADRELAERLDDQGVVLSSANSINVGRLVPQVVYYFAASPSCSRGRHRAGRRRRVRVPTVNFGDILAGYYAKRLGLPVAKLIVASDKNNVLFDFLTTGTYDRERPFHTTTSPSMDILISSNLERMLYYLSDGDCEAGRPPHG